MTGFDTSMGVGDKQPLSVTKTLAKNDSIRSARKSTGRNRNINNNSVFKTVEVASQKSHLKSKRRHGGRQNSVGHAANMTQDSTLYSMNHSVESPMASATIQNNPMANSMHVDSSMQVSDRLGPRQASSSQGVGSSTKQKGNANKKSSNKRGAKNQSQLKDMVFLYTDLGTQSKQMRQEAVASQIRKQHQEKLNRALAMDLELNNTSLRLASEMGNKPNSKAVISDNDAQK